MLLHQSKLREHIIQELASIGGKIKGDNIQILCPWHDDHSPSLEVYIGFEKLPGIFNCWSCKAKGSWNDLARALRLTQINYGEANKITEKDDPFQLVATNLKYQQTLNIEQTRILKGLEPLPTNFSWRGLGRGFYDNLGAKFYWHRNYDISYLYFPLIMNNEYTGYTLCSLNREVEFSKKYLTFADTKKVLFLYDNIPYGSPIVCTEGHFDTLRLVAEGIPATGIFGTENWSKIKREYIIAKNPPKVIICCDGDKAGYETAQTMFLDLRAGCTVDIFYLPILPKSQKLDPGNMSLEYINALRHKLGLE